jgi:hypothetical protein
MIAPSQKQKSHGGDAMGKQEGDAYPDPRKMHSGRCKTRVVICLGLVFICLFSSITVVSAPGDDLPDPRIRSIPILIGSHNDKLLSGIPTIGNQNLLVI